jgi:hypothetical protein
VGHAGVTLAANRPTYVVSKVFDGRRDAPDVSSGRHIPALGYATGVPVPLACKTG